MPGDPRDYKLDLSTGPTLSPPSGPSPPGPPTAPAADRPFLSVHFACCGVYQRVYREPDGKQYLGRCPRCGRSVRFVVGEGGTSARSFSVT
jgi:hypothetical protein